MNLLGKARDMISEMTETLLTAALCRELEIHPVTEEDFKDVKILLRYMLLRERLYGFPDWVRTKVQVKVKNIMWFLSWNGKLIPPILRDMKWG